MKNKRFMLSEGILERILQNKPCFKFRKHVNATNSFSVYISNKPIFYVNWTFLLISQQVCPPLSLNDDKPNFHMNWAFLLLSLCTPLSFNYNN